MKFVYYQHNDKTFAELSSNNLEINDTSDFLDIMANAGSSNLLIHRNQLAKEFYDLNSGMAGELLQKVSNYGVRLGIIGDHTDFDAGSMHDFIYESNRNGQIVFASQPEEAMNLMVS
ncbi:DUF4180 domain-containing protein [Spirochaeta cellobiosiphila]|uniref:DUF4180 domain-containing protein n=1 Tax=Spirochaeta cellobiosiphila TaxID=504483 RepID=UPI00040F815D|nr:DUF4180 domain-containing protein [Spirochaeta cellobiosiphila]